MPAAPTAVEPRPARTQEVLVCKPSPEGIVVYNPADPRVQYLVTGTSQHPSCGCEEFAENDGRPCAHMNAATHLLPPDPPEAEPAASQVSGDPAPTMMLKRSVSPDGRIDSLSVEFTCSVGGLNEETILNKARRALAMQEQIAEEFKGTAPDPDQPAAEMPRGDGNGNGRHNDPPDDGNDTTASPARVIELGGMNTRYGFKNFLLVDVDGTRCKLFGTRKQLADQLSAAGYRGQTGNLQVGTSLNVMCRAVTRESGDGRFTNVERLLPLSRNGARNSARR